MYVSKSEHDRCEKGQREIVFDFRFNIIALFSYDYQTKNRQPPKSKSRRYENIIWNKKMEMRCDIKKDQNNNLLITVKNCIKYSGQYSVLIHNIKNFYALFNMCWYVCQQQETTFLDTIYTWNWIMFNEWMTLKNRQKNSKFTAHITCIQT